MDDEDDAPRGFGINVISSSNRLSRGVVLPASLVCETCSRHPVLRISVVLCRHWALQAVARSKWVRFSLQRQLLVVCLASSPRSSTVSTPCLQQPSSTRSCPAENPSFASNNVFVGARVPAQPATANVLQAVLPRPTLQTVTS